MAPSDPYPNRLSMPTTRFAQSESPHSSAAESAHARDFAELAERLERDGWSAEELVAAVQRFEVALPSWAFATGGTRFGRFPGAG
ncbi:MAG: Xylose isomerase protein barrel, partial [Gemmatimonadetes bacterium]|nr:Xylose isomerase protein barrel [Gemmatimonadota bacterium]